MKFLVDTNVFLDFLLDREGFSDDVNLFLDKCFRLKNPIYITSQSLRDIEYVAHHILHDREKSLKIQMKTYQMCSKVIGISADDAISALYSETTDYEDALMIEAAQTSLVDAIITNNKKDYKKSLVPVFTVKEINSYL